MVVFGVCTQDREFHSFRLAPGCLPIKWTGEDLKWMNDPDYHKCSLFRVCGCEYKGKEEKGTRCAVGRWAKCPDIMSCGCMFDPKAARIMETNANAAVKPNPVVHDQFPPQCACCHGTPGACGCYRIEIKCKGDHKNALDMLVQGKIKPTIGVILDKACTHFDVDRYGAALSSGNVTTSPDRDTSRTLSDIFPALTTSFQLTRIVTPSRASASSSSIDTKHTGDKPKPTPSRVSASSIDTKHTDNKSNTLFKSQQAKSNLFSDPVCNAFNQQQEHPAHDKCPGYKSEVVAPALASVKEPASDDDDDDKADVSRVKQRRRRSEFKSIPHVDRWVKHFVDRHPSGGRWANRFIRKDYHDWCGLQGIGMPDRVHNNKLGSQPSVKAAFSRRGGTFADRSHTHYVLAASATAAAAATDSDIEIEAIVNRIKERAAAFTKKRKAAEALIDLSTSSGSDTEIEELTPSTPAPPPAKKPRTTPILKVSKMISFDVFVLVGKTATYTKTITVPERCKLDKALQEAVHAHYNSALSRSECTFLHPLSNAPMFESDWMFLTSNGTRAPKMTIQMIPLADYHRRFNTVRFQVGFTNPKADNRSEATSVEVDSKADLQTATLAAVTAARLDSSLNYRLFDSKGEAAISEADWKAKKNNNFSVFQLKVWSVPESPVGFDTPLLQRNPSIADMVLDELA